MSINVEVLFTELQRIVDDRDNLKAERAALAVEVAALREQLAVVEATPALADGVAAKIAAVEKTRLLTPKMLERLSKKLVEGVTTLAAVEYATGSGTNTRAVKTINILETA